MTPAQRRALAELAPRFCLPFEPAVMDPTARFGRTAPLLLEIGFGNGDSLVALAASMRDWNVLGIEVHEPGVGHCLLGIEREALEHVRLVCHDAVAVLGDMVAPGSVDRLNLYFPDPWPKKRHHKRRLFNPPFLDLVDRVLAPAGALYVATDWAPYAEHIDEVLAADERWQLDERRAHNGDAPLDRPDTKFERRGLRLGHAIVDWRVLRR